MDTTIEKKYSSLAARQDRIETELKRIQKILDEQDEGRIKPAALRRWERMSKDLDKGKGYRFSSLAEMRRWLNKL